MRTKLTAVGAAVVALALAGVAVAATGLGKPPVLHHGGPAAVLAGDSSASRHRPCPAHDSRPMKSTTVGAAVTLVPPGAAQVLVCRYSGLSVDRVKAMRLVASRLVVDRSTVNRLAGEFDALKPPPKGVAFACPNDSGRAIIAFFRYPLARKADDPVTVHLGGCGGATNGHVVVDTTLQLTTQLESLVTLPRTGTLVGAIRFVGGPFRPHRPPIAGVVSVFSSAVVRRTGRVTWYLVGHEVAREHVADGQHFRFRLVPGRYKLELAGGSDCRPATAVVRAGRTAHADVGVGCLIP